jgi:hypothetical protein
MSKRPNGGSFSADASLIPLEIRQDSCGKSPRPAQKSLAAEHSDNFQAGPKDSNPVAGGGAFTPNC